MKLRWCFIISVMLLFLKVWTHVFYLNPFRRAKPVSNPPRLLASLCLYCHPNTITKHMKEGSLQWTAWHFTVSLDPPLFSTLAVFLVMKNVTWMWPCFVFLIDFRWQWRSLTKRQTGLWLLRRCAVSISSFLLIGMKRWHSSCLLWNRICFYHYNPGKKIVVKKLNIRLV